ncbi:MAG: TetR/AcrR family transcriptional regulator [Pseudomonadota bacterium]
MDQNTTTPSRKARHNARVRANVIDAAGRAFRAYGYAGVSVDAVMTDAGLTRGAFYAHFASKAALFAEVLAVNHPLLAMLQRRSEASPDSLWLGLRRIFSDYLDPAHHDTIRTGCTLAALTADAARATPEAKAGYSGARSAILAEMARGQPVPATDPRYSAILTLAAGAVAMAAACDGDAAKRDILAAAAETVKALFDAIDATPA